MSLLSSVAIYFVIWWLVLFAVLPFGVQSQEEAGDVTLGTEHGAPHRPRLIAKLIATSIVAAILFAIVYVAIAVYGLDLEDLVP